MLPRRITVFGTADHEMGGFVQRPRLCHEASDHRQRVYNLGVWGEHLVKWSSSEKYLSMRHWWN